jgi:E3 ubiquitin-protein ligase SHPRH
MKTSNSVHHASLRARDGLYWDYRSLISLYNDMDRPSFNLKALLETLRSRKRSTEGNSKGKKRQASSDFSSSEKPRKTSKRNVSSSSTQRLVEVLSHTFTVHYSTEIPADADLRHFVRDEDTRNEWKEQEEEVRSILEDLPEGPMELGELSFKLRDAQILASFLGHECNTSWMLILPSIEDDLDVQGADIDPEMVNVATACVELASEERATLSGGLRLIPVRTRTTTGCSFTVEIDLRVSMICPDIFEPIQNTSVKQFQRQESAQRRLMEFVFPSSEQTSSSSQSTNIAFFYSILKPAPAVVSQVIQDAMQPEELITPLLPFQRRTVAWLLKREGMEVHADGKITRKHNDAEYSLWRELTVGEEKWYIHILTGALSRSPPSEVAELGAILAEEPGLGKTLETIALVLLNPPPASIQLVKNYDEVAKVSVTSVKVGFHTSRSHQNSALTSI